MDALDIFKTAPAEVTRYFETKKSVPTFDWRDIAPEEHAYSWTVAKSAGFDILEDVRGAVDDAIRNRVPFEQFQAQLTPILQDKGWWGRRKVIDPRDGSQTLAQLGSPRRLKTIYWANTRTAHAAGEWERTQRNKAFLPFLVYTLSAAERKRPEHAGWVGVVAPIDDPWWNTHYPPNGWGCKCGVRQITRRAAEGMGWSEGQTGPAVIYEPWHNKRTGETVPVPRGIDPGWANNPGKSRGSNVSQFLTGRISAMTPNRQRIAIEDVVGSPILKAMADGHMPGAYLPVAQMPAKIVEAFGSSANMVRLSSSSLGHILNDAPARDLSVSDLRAALTIFSTGTTIKSSKGGVVVLGSALGTYWRVVVKPAANGSEWWLTSFHRKSQGAIESTLRREHRKGNVVE